MGNTPGQKGLGVDMDVRAVAEAIHGCDGDDPVAHVLGRLGRRRGEVAAALGGEALQVRLVLVGEPGRETSHLLVFLPDGAAARLRPDGTLAADFHPHLTVRGRGEAVVGLVLGDVDVARAVYRGTLELHVPPDELVPRYARLMRVLAAHLLDLADHPPHL